MRFIITSFLSVVLFTPFNAQIKRASYWYFGYQAGLSFNTGAAATNTLGQMETIEGSATMSDLQGNLLFYTNGVTVYNKQHQVMTNGTLLGGDESSAQSSLIVPLPGSTDKYYLFTTNGNTNGAMYSIVDMSLSGGLGAVTLQKNVPLLSPGTEEVAATMHCNATDYWIVFRKAQAASLEFYSYHLTHMGLMPPVISSINAVNQLANVVGNLTFSQNGNVLIFTSTISDIHVFNFDKQNGIVLPQSIIVRKPSENIYSNALSPSGSKLYITSWVPFGYSYVSQFNLQAGNIQASRFDLDSVDYSNGTPNGYGYIGQLRLAPDHRIYVSRWHQKNPNQINPNTIYSLDSLDGIKFPENSAALCGFQRNLVYLDHQPTMLGLPNFVSNFTDSIMPMYSCAIATSMDRRSFAGEGQFIIFPNPSTGKVNLRVPETLMEKELSLIDHLGRLLVRFQLEPSCNNFSLEEELPSGVYYLTLGIKGQAAFTEKLLIVAD